MSEIKRLIERLCPEGVEFRKLGEVCEMQRGTSMTKKNAIEGDIPVISGGREPAFYINIANRDGETITVAGSGAGAGYVQYWNKPIFVNDAFSVKGTDTLLTKYVFYCMKNMQKKITETQKGGGVPHVHISSIENFEIPVPPLEVQRKIVEILDHFTELEARLEAELEARRKQYEYYRNALLSFDGADNNVKWMNLEEVFEMRNGYTPSKNNNSFWENGTIPWFRMEDIRENGRVLSDSIQHITSSAIKGKGLFEAGSFIMATTATIGEHAMIIIDSLANQRFTNLKIRKSLASQLDSKYCFHYMYVLGEWCKYNVNSGGFASVDMGKFKKYSFPLPPLSEQQRIVGILDRFEALTTDLQSGLPAEIAARRKQYEYYREKLLTFKRKTA